MEVLKIFQMEEPISKKYPTCGNLKSFNSVSIDGSETDQQPTQIERLKKQLLLTRGENLTLQNELAAAMKEDVENRAKISGLVKKLKEMEKKPCSPTKIKKETKIEDAEEKHKKENDEEKNNIIQMQREKIQKLEEKLKEREKRFEKTEIIGDANFNEKEMEFQSVMHEYDAFLRKVLIERQSLMEEKKEAQKHLANLEIAFTDLKEKYEQSKEVIEGLKKNEEKLKKQLDDYNKNVSTFNKKYSDLKLHAEKKISEANALILKKDKANIEEVAKLKAKILQSQVKISELEKRAGPKERDDVSIFAPLKNNLKKKK